MRRDRSGRRHGFAGLALVAGACMALAGAAPSGTEPQAVPCLSGIVRDSNGRPVANGDLDFIDVVTGVKIITRGDNTDASGFYNVCVLPGVYHVTYAPPPGTRLMGKVVPNVDLTGDRGRELDVVLDFGTVVSGTVRTTGGAPLGGVDVDVDRLSGGRVFTPDDKSDAAGVFRVVVADGGYRLRFEPPPGARWQGLQVDSFIVSRDTTLEATLSAGVLLSGRVRAASSGAGLDQVDVDLRWRDTGIKIFVANNSTDVQGEYVVAVPLGDFDVRFVPPAGSRFVGVRLDSIGIRGDSRLDAQLETGVMLTGIVRDSTGVPVANADLDLVLESTGVEVFAANDRTDVRGEARVALRPDVYRVEFNPPSGSVFDRVVLRHVAIDRDTSLAVVMPEVRRVRVTGRLVDAGGAGLAAAKFDALRLPGRQAVYLAVDASDATGAFDLSIPVGTYDVLVAPPPRHRALAQRLANVVVDRDTTWGVLQFEDGVLVSARVEDESGAAVQGVDLDLRAEPSGEEAFTPHDNTDADGVAVVSVRPGRYTVQAEPPAGRGLLPVAVPGIEVRADTSLLLVVRRAQPPPPGGRQVTLSSIAPNPFKKLAAIRYRVHQPTSVELIVYDVLGRRIRRLEHGQRLADDFEQLWDGTDAHGRRVRSGVYVVRLETPEQSDSRKVLFVH